MNAEETITLTRSDLAALIEAAVTEALSEVAPNLERQNARKRARRANDPDKPRA